jgi:hypothetical protein
MITTCERCHTELEIGDFPFCPHGHGANSISDDSCDVWVRHGIMNEDGSPKHYTSKLAIAQAAKAKGLTPMVRHVGGEGTDKSKHTQRWY